MVSTRSFVGPMAGTNGLAKEVSLCLPMATVAATFLFSEPPRHRRVVRGKDP